MVSINFSDFFHDMLILQAFRPVFLSSCPIGSEYPTSSTGDVEPDKEASRRPAREGGVRVNGSCSARNINSRRGYRVGIISQLSIPEASMRFEGMSSTCSPA